MRPIALRLACALLCLGFVAAPALAAAPCGGDFGAWLEAFEQEAAAQGVSERTIYPALSGITYDPTIITRDHAQGVFRQSFEQFSGRMVPPRLGRARKLLAKYSAIFERIEQQFGVPGPVIVAIWGLETDFGADDGKFPTIRALATLAYDCRRPTNSAASCLLHCALSSAATWRRAKCAAPGPARSARPSFCPHRICSRPNSDFLKTGFHVYKSTALGASSKRRPRADRIRNRQPKPQSAFSLRTARSPMRQSQG